MNNQGNTVTENDSSLEIKVMKDCDLNDKEFKRTAMKKLKMQENSGCSVNSGIKMQRVLYQRD